MILLRHIGNQDLVCFGETTDEQRTRKKARFMPFPHFKCVHLHQQQETLHERIKEFLEVKCITQTVLNLLLRSVLILYIQPTK